MSISLEEIARVAGVSRSTVSRVVNNHPNVNEATRSRVRNVIRELNYRPNLAARTLVTHQTRVLGLLIPQAVASLFTDPYFPTLIQGVIGKANELDYTITLSIGNSDDEEDRFIQRLFNNNFCDGYLVAAAVKNDPLIPYLASNGFPFVVIGPPPLDGINYIDVDNRHAAEAAVRHLIELGYQRIGTITGPLNMGAPIARLNAYRKALDLAGREVCPEWIVEGNFDEVSGYLCMQMLIERGVDAVFTASDMMAMGALRAIHEAGLCVPEDIGLASFDDLPMSAHLRPALTTVRQPITEVGIMATQMLVDLINGTAEPPYQKILPAQLVIRESSGAVPV